MSNHSLQSPNESFRHFRADFLGASSIQRSCALPKRPFEQWNRLHRSQEFLTLCETLEPFISNARPTPERLIRILNIPRQGHIGPAGAGSNSAILRNSENDTSHDLSDGRPIDGRGRRIGNVGLIDKSGKPAFYLERNAIRTMPDDFTFDQGVPTQTTFGHDYPPGVHGIRGN